MIVTLISPAFTVGTLLATLYGAVIHLVSGGDGRRLIATIAGAWVGFAIGQAVAQVMDIHAISLGSLNTLSASIGAVMAAILTVFLSSRRRTQD